MKSTHHEIDSTPGSQNGSPKKLKNRLGKAVGSGSSKKPRQHVGRKDDHTLFFERHRPIQNKLDHNASFDGTMFETFGPEFEQVKMQDYRRVFTVIDAEGKSYASPGFHFVNRLGYFIVEIPWTDEQELRCYKL